MEAETHTSAWQRASGCVTRDIGCVVRDIGCVTRDIGCVARDIGCVPREFGSNGLKLSTQRSAGVFAGWLGCVPAAEPPNPLISLITQHLRKPPIRRRDAAEPAGEDASAPDASMLDP